MSDREKWDKLAPQYSRAALSPKLPGWQIGKTTASITFVRDALEAIALLQAHVNSTKDGLNVFSDEIRPSSLLKDKGL